MNNFILGAVPKEKSSCGSKKVCSYVKYDGVFKSSNQEVQSLTNDELLKIVSDKLGEKSKQGLVALAFKNNFDLEGFQINSLISKKVIVPYEVFSKNILGCKRGETLVGKTIESKEFENQPIYLVSGLDISCCERNAKKNNSFYEF